LGVAEVAALAVAVVVTTVGARAAVLNVRSPPLEVPARLLPITLKWYVVFGINPLTANETGVLVVPVTGLGTAEMVVP